MANTTKETPGCLLSAFCNLNWTVMLHTACAKEMLQQARHLHRHWLTGAHVRRQTSLRDALTVAAVWQPTAHQCWGLPAFVLTSAAAPTQHATGSFRSSTQTECWLHVRDMMHWLARLR